MMRTKDGYQVCPRCSGAGCWHCQRKGYTVRCPRCGDVDSQVDDSPNFKCLVCDTKYSKSGQIVETA